MPPTHLLDTHIHLWPSTATTPSSHKWMTPPHPLATRHGLTDYLAIASPRPTGIVYMETDRALGSAQQPTSAHQLLEWAREPLREIGFLRRIVEGTGSVVEDGVEEGVGGIVRGVVLWAPVGAGEGVFGAYMGFAREVAGERLWGRVVGFRYLLQGKGVGEVGRLVGEEEWVGNMLVLGREGKAFDVGIDVHRDGEEVLRDVVGMIEEVRRRESEEKRVKFVLNHLCKPPLSTSPSPAWTSALRRLSPDTNIFMKLSGAFNEFSPSKPTPLSVDDMVASLSPFLDVVFECFPGRVMFGSDWPVCNVGGPKGKDGNWEFWREVVEGVLEERGMSEEEKESVWWGAGCKAYGIEM